ncbi:MAG: aminotransferase class V-fold PLP-dependent enzyme [Gemmatimonadetes bacterium]|nr:MAG: aminotransferase class V-fold PLP-dependent enzyme [Gemmatimonadota bacterium]
MALSLDVERLRADTPGAGERIHLNNAGAALMPAPVLRRVREHLELEAHIGGYEAAEEVSDEVESARADVGRLVGAEPRNIAFTEHATASFVQALSSIPFRAGDVLVTSRADYVSNQIQYLSLAERLGIEVLRLPDGPDGTLDLHALEAALQRRRPRAVALSHVPTYAGLVQPAAAVGALCRRHGVLYLLDACQSVGQMPLEVADLGCDFLAATARKFLRGPRGAGFLYVSDRVLDEGLTPLFVDLQGADWVADDVFQPLPDARRFETWEFAYALLLGMGEAARYALDLGLDAIARRTRALSDRLRAGLNGLDAVTVLDEGEDRAAIVPITVRGWRPDALMLALRARGVNTSTLTRASAVLEFDARGVEGALRLSPHYYNTEAEIDEVLRLLDAFLAFASDV